MSFFLRRNIRQIPKSNVLTILLPPQHFQKWSNILEVVQFLHYTPPLPQVKSCIRPVFICWWTRFKEELTKQNDAGCGCLPNCVGSSLQARSNSAPLRQVNQRLNIMVRVALSHIGRTRYSKQKNLRVISGINGKFTT